MFRLKNIKFLHILNIESLDIENGKITCIIGESGSGKTTLLKLFNKMITADSGEMFYNGKNIKEIDSVLHRREVVMLPQIPTVFPGTIKENLLIGLKFSEKPEVADEVLENILKEVRLDKKISEKVADLSGGEKQRLALGRIMIMEPEVLLLDEPSSALDEETEKIIMENLVSYVKKNNKTLIIVTHSKKLAQNYSDRILEIYDGRVREWDKNSLDISEAEILNSTPEKVGGEQYE